jgi:hypothetical protein
VNQEPLELLARPAQPAQRVRLEQLEPMEPMVHLALPALLALPVQASPLALCSLLMVPVLLAPQWKAHPTVGRCTPMTQPAGRGQRLAAALNFSSLPAK